MTSRVLVTGGSGFIGTNLVQYYAERGCQVLNIDHKPPRDPSHSKIFKPVDLLDPSELEKAIRNFDPHYVLHFAARTDLRETRDINGYRANTEGTRNLIAACESCSNVTRVLFSSSMLVCRFGYTPKNSLDYCPNNLYGRSKVLMEELVRERQLPFEWALVRPTSIWGPWFGPPYDTFFRFVLSGRFVHPGNRSGTSTYGYVGNTVYQVDQLLHARADRIQGRVFYLGDLPPNNLSEWAEEIARLAGRGKLPKAPFSILKLGALFGDGITALGLPFPLTSFRLGNMTTDNRCDLGPIYEIAPSPPFARMDGVMATLEWLKR